MTNNSESFNTHITDFIKSNLFQGLAAFAGLITSVLSDNLIYRIPALFVFFGMLFKFRAVIIAYIRKGLDWLTWRFVVGIFIGMILGALLTPLLKPVYLYSVYFLVPHIKMLESHPENSGMLYSASSGVLIDFSEPIPSLFQNPLYFDVEIYPSIPFNIDWIGGRTLCIQSNKFFKGNMNTQFEPNKMYSIKINSPLLDAPVEITFHTPDE